MPPFRDGKGTTTRARGSLGDDATGRALDVVARFDASPDAGPPDGGRPDGPDGGPSGSGFASAGPPHVGDVPLLEGAIRAGWVDGTGVKRRKTPRKG